MNLDRQRLSATRIFGNAGANVLDGKGGNDALVGCGGADFFAFTTALGAGNVDTIVDFVAGTDKIGLDDAIFTGIGGTLNANAFVIGAAAADIDDRIVYNQRHRPALLRRRRHRRRRRDPVRDAAGRAGAERRRLSR